jgi:hypothetical protein
MLLFGWVFGMIKLKHYTVKNNLNLPFTHLWLTFPLITTNVLFGKSSYD